MLWLEDIRECVKSELDRLGKSPETLAKEMRASGRSRVSSATVRAVLDAEPGTRANSIDLVAEALGLTIAATCVPATAGESVESIYAAAITELRTRDEGNQETMADLKSARDLLGLCQHLASLGLAAEAVRVLYRWRAGADEPSGGRTGTAPLT